MTDKIEIRITLDAPPSRVFEAWTRAGELEQWFAEKAFISEPEKRYDFWGRFTPEAPGPDSGRHRLLAHESPSKLGFSWRVRGEETTVDIGLEKTERGTLLRLKQDVPGRPKTNLSLADFWMLSLENLRLWLKNGSPPVRCDYSSRARGDVELAVDIEATREAVFGGLIRPEELNRWIAAKAEVEPVRGGRISFGWPEGGPIKILEIVPNQKLAYSWAEDVPETVVTWTLQGSGSKTRLLLVHSGFAADRGTEDYRTGWLKHVVWLKSMLEEGPSWKGPEPVTTDWTAV